MGGDKLSAYPTLNIRYPIDSVEPTVSYKLYIGGLLIHYIFNWHNGRLGECEDVIILQGNPMALNIPSVNDSDKADDPI